MARSGVSLQELMGALEKSGLPMGDSVQMQGAGIGARDAIRGSMGNGQVDQLKQNYLGKLNQIAAMDKKLSGVYSDPSSSLYIEHAGARENATFGRRETDMTQVGDIAKSIVAEQNRIERETDEALSLYKQLTALTKSEETRLQKEAKKKKALAYGSDLDLEGLLDELNGEDDSLEALLEEMEAEA